MDDDDAIDEESFFSTRHAPERLAVLSQGIKVYGHWLSDDELAARADEPVVWSDSLDEIGICMRTVGERRSELREALVAAITEFDLAVGVDVSDDQIDTLLETVDERVRDA